MALDNRGTLMLMPDGKPITSHRFSKRTTTIDFMSQPALKVEKELLELTDVSNMKGHSLVSHCNSSLVVVTCRCIAYACKGGQIRVISQTGENNFKLPTLEGNAGPGTVPVISLALAQRLETQGRDDSQGPSLILALDKAGDLRGFELMGSSTVEEESTRKWHIQFNVDESELPERVTHHPSHNIFVTLHRKKIAFWTRARWTDFARHNEPFRTKRSSELLESAAGREVQLPEGTTLVDATFSSDGFTLFVLVQSESDETACAILVYKLNALLPWLSKPQAMEDAPVISYCQEVAAPAGATSLRVMGDSKHLADNALLLTAEDGGDWSVYLYDLGFSGQAVGAVLQRIDVSGATGCGLRIAHDRGSPSSIFLLVEYRPWSLHLSLAKEWKATKGLPISHASRIWMGDELDQLECLRAQSYKKNCSTIFFYLSRHFKKDGKDRCDVRVGEVTSASLLDPEEAVALPPSIFDHSVVVRSTWKSLREVAPGTTSKAATSAAAMTRPPGLEDEPESEAPLSSQSQRQQRLPPGQIALGPAAKAGMLSSSASRGKIPTQAAEAEVQEVFLLPDEDKQEIEGHKNGTKMDGSPADSSLAKELETSFIKKLESRREEMVERLLQDVNEFVKDLGVPANSGGEYELSILQASLSQVRQARECHAESDKGLTAAIKKAADAQAEASTSAFSKVLQKELAEATDGIAAGVASQLAQSKKFNDAFARGIKKVSTMATKEALDAVRPSVTAQDLVKSGITEAMQDSFVPIFRTELKSHLEKVLAPLLEQRIGEMMASLQSSVVQFLEGVAKDQGEAMKKASQELGAAVAQELQEVDRIVAKRGPAGASGITEAQLDDLAAVMQSEVVQPMQAEVEELRAEVKRLQILTTELNDRWRRAMQQGSLTGSSGESPVSGRELEATQLAGLERTFDAGKVEDAFMKAVKEQQTARHEDFLGKLCARAGRAEEWLASNDLSIDARMMLLLALAQQLDQNYDEQALGDKIEWMEELWLIIDLQDLNNQDGGKFLEKLQDCLQRVPSTLSPEASKPLRKLSKQVLQAAKLRLPRMQ